MMLGIRRCRRTEFTIRLRYARGAQLDGQAPTDPGHVRDDMVLTRPHPTLGDLDVPASPLDLSWPRRSPGRGVHRLLRSGQGGPVTPTRIAVIGGGIVGIAIAREIITRHPDAEVTVFEKEIPARRASDRTQQRRRPCRSSGGQWVYPRTRSSRWRVARNRSV